jgi:two-component system phosphate regulon sensor histidine kinase PhoR
MFGELLSLGRATDRQTAKDYAEIIIRESDRLTSLIDNVLDFARIERGKAAYEMVEGDLAPVVERAVELCSYRSEQAGVRLEAEIAEDLPRFPFDASAMTLLLLNLIENALRYGVARGGTIRVSARVRDEFVVVAVADDGPGIAEDEKRRIFDRFYRGRSRSHSRGSGIGLSLVKHIAEAHGGSVQVQSELGKGATFEVSIPV